MSKYLYDDEDNVAMNDAAYQELKEKGERNRNGLRKREMPEPDDVRAENHGEH